MQAALTGHLVLSTLHTNDAIGALSRMVDMGVEPYLLASALAGVVAQRLVRHVCPGCKTSYLAPPELAERHGWSQAEPIRLVQAAAAAPPATTRATRAASASTRCWSPTSRCSA